jgi:hypothetical protein
MNVAWLRHALIHAHPSRKKKHSFAMSSRSKQMRVPLRRQITSKNHISIRTLIPRNLHHRNPKMRHSCMIIKSKAMQSSIYDKTLKETVSPYMIRNIYYSNSEPYLRYGVILLGGNNENNNIFNCYRRSLVLSGVSIHTSCR